MTPSRTRVPRPRWPPAAPPPAWSATRERPAPHPGSTPRAPSPSRRGPVGSGRAAKRSRPRRCRLESALQRPTLSPRPPYPRSRRGSVSRAPVPDRGRGPEPRRRRRTPPTRRSSLRRRRRPPSPRRAVPPRLPSGAVAASAREGPVPGIRGSFLGGTRTRRSSRRGVPRRFRRRAPSSGGRRRGRRGLIPRRLPGSLLQLLRPGMLVHLEPYFGGDGVPGHVLGARDGARRHRHAPAGLRREPLVRQGLEVLPNPQPAGVARSARSRQRVVGAHALVAERHGRVLPGKERAVSSQALLVRRAILDL